MGIRLVIVDDNPHVTWDGRTYPVNATFQHFAAALLDLPGSPVETITSCVPLRVAAIEPGTLPLDPRIRVVGTAPFDGIEGYLRHLPAMLRANRPILRRAIAGADLVWLKVPASNAALAAALARSAGVPRFGYVAGSAADVAAGQARSGIAGVGARLVGIGYDLVGRAASTGGDRVVVGRDLDGAGIVTSLVEPAEIRDRDGDPWPAIPWRLRLAWAGRLAQGKGLEVLLEALASLVADEAAGHRVELVILGDGPARGSLEARAVQLGIADRIHWLGYVADRHTYLDALATCDLFVFPSPAEGFPKVVLDAMAVGAAGGGPAERVAGSSWARIAWRSSRPTTRAPSRPRSRTPSSGWSRRPSGRRAFAAPATTFAAAHTRQAEAARLVERWQARWPGLPWA